MNKPKLTDEKIEMFMNELRNENRNLKLKIQNLERIVYWMARGQFSGEEVQLVEKGLDVIKNTGVGIGK